MESNIEIYQSSDGNTVVEVKFDQDTAWLNQYQLAELFSTDRTSITKHLKNIFETGELDEMSTCAKIAQVRREGKRQVKRDILYYNLDVIISVGYRVNSKQGTQFRIWATKRLKEYLVQGYTINEKRLAQKNQEIQFLKDGISIFTRAVAGQIENIENKNEWLSLFSNGLKLLSARGRLYESLYNLLNYFHCSLWADLESPIPSQPVAVIQKKERHHGHCISWKTKEIA
ncbi:MAG: hypothetical protein CSA04_04190 [Bacteroidetes bacterium]|nr:MAG: hypothetical protein CSA04_04190 [Bacteroidota bacterium]